MNSVESLQNRRKGAAVTRKHGYKINTASIEAQHAAEEMMLQIENDMKNASAKLAAEQAERMVQDSIKASMERIDSENENMRTWEENMVRRSGYHVDGKSIHREAVVDSSLGHTYYEGQSVHYSEDFYNAGPTISVSLSKTMLEGLNSSAIMLLVEQANYDIEKWSKQVFGNTEKDEDGNVVLKQIALVRDSFYNDDVDRFKTLSKKDYDKLSEDEQKEFNDLSTGIVSVRDGMLGEWIGYAPVFKDGNSGLDLSNSRESNIKYQGDGQMGQIMLDFQWNCMIEQQGWQKVALPAYDQPLWRGNGSWFEPPTIRGVASIVFEIVGQASSQAWFSYADDLIFAAIDVGGGFKSAEQVGLDLAKTAVISMGCSAAGNALSSSVSAAMDGAGKAMEGAGKFANFAAQAGISVATTYVSTVATSAVNNVQLGADGKLTFDKDNFGKSLYSASTIAGAVGAGFTAGLNEISVGARTEKVKNPKTGKMENQVTYTRANGLSSAQIASIQSLNGLAGDLVQNGVSLAMGGDATFNILEVSFGKNGFKSRIGMGGTNISVNSLLNSMNGAKDWDKSEKINDYVDGKDLSPEEKKKLADALRMQYGFGDTDQLKNLDDILSGKTSLGGTDTDGKAQTVAGADGSKTIMMAMSEGMDWKELGLLIGHEAYRDGIVSDEQTQKDETREAVKGHTEMASKMLGDVLYASSMKQLIDNNQNLQMDLLARALGEDFFNAYIDGTYDSSADYWLFKLDGSIEDDEKYYFSREVVNEKGEYEPEKIKDSDFNGSKSLALLRALGLENVQNKMLDESITSLGQISKDVIQSALGLDIDKIPSSEYKALFENNKEKLIAEYLLTSNGVNWNEKTKKWEGGDLKISGLETNDSLGVIRDSKTGKYTFFTAGIDFTREDNAFSVYKDGSIPLKDDGTVNRDWDKYKKDVYDKVANTSATFWMKDVFTGKDIARETFDNAFTSLDNVYHKNSIVSEYFNMRLIKYDPETYGVDTVGLFSNAYTAAGKAIDIGGFDGTSSKRFLYHPTSQYGTMEGCFGPMSDYGVGNSTTQNTGTSAYYFQQQLNLYNSLGIYNGYQFNIHLKGRLKP